MKVTFEIDTADSTYEYHALTNALDMTSDMHEIYNLVRQLLKHCDQEIPEEIEQVLEDIKVISGGYFD
jgi:hypothetical protein